MTLHDITSTIIAFVSENQAWAMPLVFTLAFLESLAFLSLLVPATGILLGIGALVGAAGIEFWPLWLAGGIGGAMGYSISYWLGYWYREGIFASWPFRTRPELVRRSEDFFHRYGVFGVFFGHFVGPIRAVIPVVAGSFRINHISFEVANITASFLWITAVLAPGYLISAQTAFSDLFR